MNTLSISLFGRMRLWFKEPNVEIALSRLLQKLLAYLLINRSQFLKREVLTGLFWGDQSELKARNCLNTTLWRLRAAIEIGNISKGTYLMTMSTGEIGFNTESDHWLDVAAFEEKTSEILNIPVNNMAAFEAIRLEHTLQLYSGELLQGYYSDWILTERERLQARYLKCIEHLMRYYGDQRSFEKAIALGQKILQIDPLREEIHRELMRFYMENGQRIQAMRHYDRCCQILEAELDIEPMDETRELYSKIRQVIRTLDLNESSPSPEKKKQLAEKKDLIMAIHKLNNTVSALGEIHNNIFEAVQLLRQYDKII